MMKGFLAAGAAGLFLLSATPASANLPLAIDGQELPSLAPLIEQAGPAVVNIATQGSVEVPNPFSEDPFFRRFFGVPPGQRREVRSAGSGVIVDAENGYIITNHHVIENADEIVITLADNRSFEAEIIGSDPGTDVAVLRVDDAEDLVEMPFANSDELAVGDFVIAIGNPFGLGHTVTSGIVSALGRSQSNSLAYEDFIQTDASINPGNSGGALVDLRGQLVGVNTAIYTRSGGNIGIGFAIPANIVENIMGQILEFGEVRRGLLGVTILDFTPDMAEAFGWDVTEGALIQEVVSGSAADNAGIEVEDVIVSVAGEAVGSASDLRNAIGLRQSGETVAIELIRDGKRRTVRATLDEAQTASVLDPAEIHPGFEGTVLEDYDGDSDMFGGEGILIADVAQGSRAARNRLRPGDIITHANRSRVRSINELAAEAENARVLVLAIRRGNNAILRQVQ